MNIRRDQSVAPTHAVLRNWAIPPEYTGRASKSRVFFFFTIHNDSVQSVYTTFRQNQKRKTTLKSLFFLVPFFFREVCISALCLKKYCGCFCFPFVEMSLVCFLLFLNALLNPCFIPMILFRLFVFHLFVFRVSPRLPNWANTTTIGREGYDHQHPTNGKGSHHHRRSCPTLSPCASCSVSLLWGSAAFFPLSFWMLLPYVPPPCSFVLLRYMLQWNLILTSYN